MCAFAHIDLGLHCPHLQLKTYFHDAADLSISKHAVSIVLRCND